ncbi:MAG: hypothetical protein JXK05_09970 [Campylobacterales bacterium]|nr:hypothetical protein [Campylobacterales bacterium]
MKTVQLDIQDDKLETFLMIVRSLKDDIVQSIRMQDAILDVESIQKNTPEYHEIEEIKSQNNPKHSLSDAKIALGL